MNFKYPEIIQLITYIKLQNFDNEAYIQYKSNLSLLQKGEHMVNIETIRSDRLSEEDIICKLSNKQAHYISWAVPGLTFSAFYCEAVAKLSSDTYKQLFWTVNQKRETGTLYPLANITILPIERANYYMDSIEHHKGYTYDERLDHLKDAFIANRDYIKSNQIYIDVRDIEHNYTKPTILMHTINKMCKTLIEQEKYTDMSISIIFGHAGLCRKALGSCSCLLCTTDKKIF